MDITTREDIDRLIRVFYNKVRVDALLAPIFNTIISREELWEHHFIKLVDFWEAGLFQNIIYDGRPISLHLFVDHNTGRKIKQVHFDRWLELWNETIDELFEGQIADSAKRKAHKMGTKFHDKIIRSRR